MSGVDQASGKNEVLTPQFKESEGREEGSKTFDRVCQEKRELTSS